jgi:hypothetical protein
VGVEPVNFTKLPRERFDRVVEALLLAEYGVDGTHVQVIDGRGGDDGIDVGVWDAEENIVHVFQLKHYPEGLSGKFSGRCDKVKDSFDTAWKTNQPPKWTLVIPRNPSIDEHAKVREFAHGKPIVVDIFG